ncbi:hypothetical protein MRB53_038415 [Persea americana]|nr:hypothetical protein MRB53_038415 [Persea americana]
MTVKAQLRLDITTSSAFFSPYEPNLRRACVQIHPRLSPTHTRIAQAQKRHGFIPVESRAVETRFRDVSASSHAQCTMLSYSDTPVQFSQALVNSLQDSAETDSTRARNLEHIIQARVTSELEKLLSNSTQRLTEQSEAASKEDSRPSAAPSLTEKPLLNRLTEKITGAVTSSDEEKKKELDRSAVQKEIDALRKKLDSRRKVVEKDAAVEKAKDEVVTCLRLNDRRPLDC